MQVDVIPNVNEARSDDFINKTVIVVDVLRASSSIVTALEHGCKGIIPVETVCQARSLQKANELLGGERFCKKISGFDFGNSPLEYMASDLQGKTVIMTTTNGTRAIYKSQKAMNVILGSMLNAASCVKTAIELKRDIVIVCAGTQDEFALEDGLCAGLIIEEIKELTTDGDEELNDVGIAMHSTYKYHRDHLEETLLHCASGKRLNKIGNKEDVIFCAQINLFSTVPILRDQVLIPYQVLK